MVIKKYVDFINEKMGVPDKIINSATNLYELILSDFEKRLSDTTISDMIVNGFDDVDRKVITFNEYQIDLPIQIEIADLKFNSVKLEVGLLPAISLEKDKVDVISWGVSNMPDKDNDYKLYYDKTLIDKIDMRVNFAISNDASGLNNIRPFVVVPIIPPPHSCCDA